MSGLFGSSPPPPPPEPKPPAPMPDPESPAVKEAKRMAALNILNRAGRDSTILTTPQTRANGDYSARKLGNTP